MARAGAAGASRDPDGNADPAGRAPRHSLGRRRGRRTRRERLRRSALALLVVAGLIAAVGAVAYEAGWTSTSSHPSATPPTPSPGTPTPSVTPSPTATGPALWEVPAAAASALLTPRVDLGANARVPTAAGLARRLTPELTDPTLAGDSVVLSVSDPLSGKVLWTHDAPVAGQPVQPASTAKLAVAAAALEVLGPDRRLSTKVVEVPPHDADDVTTVVLVGGGDPTLAGPTATGAHDPGFPEPARLVDLVAPTVAALRASGTTSVRVGYDTSAFSGAAIAVGWKPTYLTEGDVAPVSALEVDEGQPDLSKPARASDPAAVAAADFAALLGGAGLHVVGRPQRAAGTGAGVRQLAAVTSPPVGALVQRMLDRSDNDLAEALARQVARAQGEPATFAGGVAGVRAALRRLGVDDSGFGMVDASGLSTSDRLRPATLVQLLDVVVRGGHPELAAILSGLPVAGFSGTLDTRFATPPAQSAAGDVRAKTGTLDGVVTLAGYVQDADGRLLVFTLFTGGVKVPATIATEHAIDRISAALAACGCS